MREISSDEQANSGEVAPDVQLTSLFDFQFQLRKTIPLPDAVTSIATSMPAKLSTETVEEHATASQAENQLSQAPWLTYLVESYQTPFTVVLFAALGVKPIAYRLLRRDDRDKEQPEKSDTN